MKRKAKKKKTNKKSIEKKLPKLKPGKKLKKPQFKQIEKKIKSLIAEVLEIKESKITPKARFIEDLGMDSMMALEILAAIEKTYKIEVPEESLTKLVNLSEVLKLTNGLLSEE